MEDGRNRWECSARNIWCRQRKSHESIVENVANCTSGFFPLSSGGPAFSLKKLVRLGTVGGEN